MEAPLYLTAAMTGLRQGELIALRWIDVDWSASRIRVADSYVRGAFDSPKNHRGRSVPMADRLAGELERHFQASRWRAENDLVFAHPVTGHVLDSSKLRKRFYVALERAGGMVGSRTIDRLARHAAETDAKLVLVGDDRQLPEIDAGGAFRGLAEHLGAIELHQVRRQHADWDREALAELRDRDVRAWTAAYRDHGRIVARPTARELRAALVDDWWEAARTGEQDAVMIAHRRSDVADLNALAHARMQRDGRLGDEDLVAGERSFSVGDRVIARRNDRRAGVINGARGEV